MTNTKLSTYVKYILRNRYFWSIIAFAFVFLGYKNAFAAADAEYRQFCLSDEFTNKYENATDLGRANSEMKELRKSIARVNFSAVSTVCVKPIPVTIAVLSFSHPSLKCTTQKRFCGC